MSANTTPSNKIIHDLRCALHSIAESQSLAEAVAIAKAAQASEKKQRYEAALAILQWRHAAMEDHPRNLKVNVIKVAYHNVIEDMERILEQMK
jgi:hypothetical protein